MLSTQGNLDLSFSLFHSAGDGIQNLVHARVVLCQWAMPSAPKFFLLERMKGGGEERLRDF